MSESDISLHHPQDNTTPPQQQDGDEQQQQQFDNNIEQEEPITYVQGHIRGFRTDRENRPQFGLNYDTTSKEEQDRRRERLLRFNTGDINVQTQIESLDRFNEEAQRAQSRLDRFTSNDTTTPSYNSDDFDPLNAAITHSFPQIMPFEDLNKIPENQIQYELRSFAPTAPRRWDTIHLFGTRLLEQGVRTEDLLTHYKEDGLMRVEWQSDYRCNLVFTDADAARRVLDMESYVNDLDIVAAKRHFPLQCETKTDEENQRSFDHAALPFMVWRQSIHSENLRRHKGSLVMRLATSEDIKEPLEVRTHSQFYLDNKAYFNDIIRIRRAKDRNNATEQDGMDDKTVDIEADKVLKAPLPHQNERTITTSAANNRPNNQSNDSNTRPVEKVAEVGRGRGFAKGRSGTFDMNSRIRVEKVNHSMNNDTNNMTGRDRDRSYQRQPLVLHESTPLIVTLQHNEEKQQLKREKIQRENDKRIEIEKRREHNSLTRILGDQPTRVDHLVTLPHADNRIFQPNDVVKPELEQDNTAMAAMYVHVAEQDEIQRQQEEQTAALRRQERERLEAQRAEQMRIEEEMRVAAQAAETERIQQQQEAEAAMVQEVQEQQEFNDYE